jgi:hypothetical protein
MAFASGDWIRVLKHLELTIAFKATVLLQLQAAESEAGLETEVKAILTTLDNLRASLATNRGDVNASLIKADVLEWEAGRRLQGIEEEYWLRQRELANFLGLEWISARGGGSASSQVEVWHG